MATTNAQRIGISIILAVTIIGTLGSFAVMILSQQNAVKDAKIQQEEYDKYQKQVEEYQAKVQAQADQLSAKYHPVFSQYAGQVAEFNLDEAEKGGLKTDDVLVGDGEEVTDTTKLSAYYIGYLPSGKIFDQSIDGEKLKAPFGLTPTLADAQVITGWREGIKGMKMGGVRVITIPSEKAYGEAGRKDATGKETIPANTPLKFIVMAIPVPEEIAAPEYPQSMLQGLY